MDPSRDWPPDQPIRPSQIARLRGSIAVAFLTWPPTLPVLVVAVLLLLLKMAAS